jgi:hypothetical protein
LKEEKEKEQLLEKANGTVGDECQQLASIFL